MNERIRHPDGIPPRPDWRFHVAPLATGSKVIEDERIFDRLSKTAREVLGLEMEAHAIGAVAWDQQRRFLVMKGVMDHADSFKDDRFKAYAARASAECLIAFLRQHLPADAGSLLDPGEAPLPANHNPATLLNARFQKDFLPFWGREAELDDLLAWCGSSRHVAVRLYHGPGGMGKTRFLTEVCGRLRERGWRAGFLTRSGDAHRDRQALVAAVEDGGPALVVVDYAETDQDRTQLLLRVAAELDEQQRGGLRLVLLARNTGEWWEYHQRLRLRNQLQPPHPCAAHPSTLTTPAQPRRLPPPFPAPPLRRLQERPRPAPGSRPPASRCPR